MPRPECWSDSEWELLGRLVRREPSWLKAAYHPDMFHLTPRGLLLAVAGLERGAQPTLRPHDDGTQLQLIWGHGTSAVLHLPEEILHVHVGTFPRGALTDRLLADVAGSIPHVRDVRRRGEQVDVGAGVVIGGDPGLALNEAEDLRRAYKEAFAGAARHGFEDVVDTFMGAGLFVPHIPTALRPRLRRLDEWLWSTLDPAEVDRMADYMFDTHWMSQPTVDHVTLSHGGQGINSYGLTLRIAFGKLTVMAQGAWGGVYGSPEDNAALAALFAEVAALTMQLEQEPTPEQPDAWGRPHQLECSLLRDSERPRLRQWDPQRWEWSELPLDDENPWRAIRNSLGNAGSND